MMLPSGDMNTTDPLCKEALPGEKTQRLRNAGEQDKVQAPYPDIRVLITVAK